MVFDPPDDSNAPRQALVRAYTDRPANQTELGGASRSENRNAIRMNDLVSLDGNFSTSSFVLARYSRREPCEAVAGDNLVRGGPARVHQSFRRERNSPIAFSFVTVVIAALSMYFFVYIVFCCILFPR